MFRQNGSLNILLIWALYARLKARVAEPGDGRVEAGRRYRLTCSHWDSSTPEAFLMEELKLWDKVCSNQRRDQTMKHTHQVSIVKASQKSKEQVDPSQLTRGQQTLHRRVLGLLPALISHKPLCFLPLLLLSSPPILFYLDENSTAPRDDPWWCFLEKLLLFLTQDWWYTRRQYRLKMTVHISLHTYFWRP